MKVEQRREAEKAKEKEICTFKPSINKQSAAIAKSRSLGRQGKKQYESLYEEATQRGEILEKQAADFYSKVCTFKPKVNPPPPEIADRIAQVDFMERGLQHLTKKEEAIKVAKTVQRRDPDIGAKASKRPPHLHIHEYLYGIADKQKRDLEDLRKSQAMETIKKNSIQKSEAADKVVWESMDKKLTSLFEIFDIDGDG